MNKNKKFEDIDFEDINQNIDKIDNMQKNYPFLVTKMNHRNANNCEQSQVSATISMTSDNADTSLAQDDSQQMNSTMGGVK